MPSPLDPVTKLLGLPDGFLDAIYPWSLYQTVPPVVDRTPPQMGPPSVAAQPQTSPNPLGQALPPGPVDAFLRQAPPMAGMPGMGATPPSPLALMPQLLQMMRRPVRR